MTSCPTTLISHVSRFHPNHKSILVSTTQKTIWPHTFFSYEFSIHQSLQNSSYKNYLENILTAHIQFMWLLNLHLGIYPFPHLTHENRLIGYVHSPYNYSIHYLFKVFPHPPHGNIPVCTCSTFSWFFHSNQTLHSFPYLSHWDFDSCMDLMDP